MPFWSRRSRIPHPEDRRPFDSILTEWQKGSPQGKDKGKERQADQLDARSFSSSDEQEAPRPALQSEEAAVERSGMPEDLVKLVKKFNKLLGNTMTIFRVGTHPNYSSTRRVAKSVEHKIKCTDHGLGDGFLCASPGLGKKGKDGKAIPLPAGIRTYDYDDVLKKDISTEDAQETVQLSLPLAEILLHVRTVGDMKIIGVDGDADKGYTLVFAYKDGYGPTDFKGSFSVNLEDPNSKYYPSKYIRRSDQEAYESLLHEINEDPPRLSVQHGVQLDEPLIQCIKFSLINQEYPIYYRQIDPLTLASRERSLSPSSSFSEEAQVGSKLSEGDRSQLEKLRVFSDGGKPITGDWDLDSESIPLGLPDSAYKPIYINYGGDFDNQKELYNNAKKIFKAYKEDAQRILRGKPPIILSPEMASSDDPDVIELLRIFRVSSFDEFFRDASLGSSIPYFSSRIGNATPYIFFKNVVTNYFFRTKYSESYNPLQHSSEDYSPYRGDGVISADVNAKKYVVYNGTSLDFNKEEEKIKLYLSEGFLEKNVVSVSFDVSMEKWHKVIELQIALGQKKYIDDITLQSYKIYKSIQEAQGQGGEITMRSINKLKEQKKQLAKMLRQRFSDWHRETAPEQLKFFNEINNDIIDIEELRNKYLERQRAQREQRQARGGRRDTITAWQNLLTQENQVNDRQHRSFSVGQDGDSSKYPTIDRKLMARSSILDPSKCSMSIQVGESSAHLTRVEEIRDDVAVPSPTVGQKAVNGQKTTGNPLLVQKKRK